ncbi:MAG: cytochrome c [Myxococcota bacterium]|nr:cytochrome c [Myxococcota bacterium]
MNRSALLLMLLAGAVAANEPAAPGTPVATAEPTSLDAGTSVPPSPPVDWAQQGQVLYARHICAACHSNDGTQRAAPSFKGLYGTQQRLRDGSAVRVDDTYIRESILDPGAKVAHGFQPVMPSYLGRLTPEDLEALIAYIQSLR